MIKNLNMTNNKSIQKIINRNDSILLSVSYVFNIILTQQCFYLVSHIFLSNRMVCFKRIR